MSPVYDSERFGIHFVGLHRHHRGDCLGLGRRTHVPVTTGTGLQPGASVPAVRWREATKWMPKRSLSVHRAS